MLSYVIAHYSSEKRQHFGGKKGLRSSFIYLELFCLDILLPTGWILLKQLFLEPEWALS